MKNIMMVFAALLSTVHVFPQARPNINAANSISALANFEASRKGNLVQLSWVALHESEVVSHEIQKSANGTSFRNIGTLRAQNDQNSYAYRFVDATPVQGDNYYRLRTVDKNGNATLSDILKVDDGLGRTDLRVLGNPVRGGVLNLQLSNITSGKYFVSLYNSTGEKVFAHSLNMSDGSMTQTINLPRALGNGTYFLELCNGDLKINREVMLQ